MKQINVNVRGTPTDTPVLTVDGAGGSYRATLSEGRAAFALEDREVTGHGATIRYAGGQSLRVLVPPYGAWEADEPPVKPPEAIAAGAQLAIVYTSTPAIVIVGDHFQQADGARWLLKGATEFRLVELFQADRGRFDAVVAQRLAAGANVLRVLCMKANNTGWSLAPASPGLLADVQGALDAVGAIGLFCVFADTRAVLPFAIHQRQYWGEVCPAIRRPHFVQCCNEWNHPTQAIDPSDFDRPGHVDACHGSGLTDADPVSPRWDFACYHARRDGLPDARGITNYDPYEFQARYPQPGPLVAAEGLKPQHYGFDPTVARLMGAHAALGAGGFFHSDEGVNGLLWSPSVEACARAFYEALR